MIRIVKMHFRDEEISNFKKLFDEVYPKINAFPGCQSVKLLQDKNLPNILFTYSIWDDANALEKYRNSDLFAKTWKRTKALFAFKAEAWSVDEITPVFNNSFLANST